MSSQQVSQTLSPIKVTAPKAPAKAKKEKVVAAKAEKVVKEKSEKVVEIGRASCRERV